MTTKLGPSAINGTADARAWAARAPVVKQQSHTDVLQAAHENAIRVYRWPFRDQDLTAPAERVRDAILNGLAGYRHPNLYVEVYVGIPGSMWRAHLAFLQRVVPLLHAAGLKVIGPSWYTGDYEREAWEGFRAAGWAGLDLIGVQAYWSTAGFSQWNALRWRQYWQPGDLPVVVVECGRDQVRDGPNGTLLPREGSGRFGFQRQGVGDEQAIRELVAYDTELRKGDECVGALPFVCGPTDDWRDSGFDLDPIAGRLALLSTPRASAPQSTTPTPQPAPAPNQPTQEHAMRLALLYRMGADVPEKNVDELADLCHRGGFSAISPKAMDGDAWEGAFDGDPVLAIHDADDLQLQKLAYEKAGLGYEPWVVYRGLDAGAEATAHATVGRICRTLIVDFEWRYPGFADRGSWDDAVRYFRLLREGALGVTIVFCPDPRQVRRAEYPVADVLPYVDVISPQVYWTDFQQPWSQVLDDGLFADYGGRDVWPMLPANSEPGDLDKALTRLENEWHSARPPTVYLFQRVGLREANLPVLAEHKTLGEAHIGEPSEEDAMPKPDVDPAAYEDAFWGPLFRRNQQSAATVAQLRATGKHADALLADALEASDAQVRAAVALNKVAHGAEAA